MSTTQFNLEAMQAPNGQRYLSVIIETAEQDERGVWGLPTKIADVASFPVDARWPSGNPWGSNTRRAAERFMWSLDPA